MKVPWSRIIIVVVLLGSYAGFVSYLYFTEIRENYRDYEYEPEDDLSVFIFPDNTDLNETILDSIQMGSDYLLQHIKPTGQWNYEFNASSGESNEGYNILRHAGTTYSLALSFRYTRDLDHYNGTLKTTNFMLSRYTDFEKKGGREIATFTTGTITKLGGPALALLALIEIERVNPEFDLYGRELRGFKNFIIEMQKDDGSFQCYYGGNEGKHSDYYPGEALLALAKYHYITNDTEALDALRDGLDYYNDYFPDTYTAYSPWATEAMAYLHSLEGGDHLKEKAFKLADACSRGQIREKTTRDPFFTGAFSYSARSSTSSRVEAVCDSYLLALRINDTGNMEDYRYSIDLCGGFLMRLQIDEDDASVLPDPERSVGGIPNERYDLTIRIDNVQHTLVVLTKIMVYQGGPDHI